MSERHFIPIKATYEGKSDAPLKMFIDGGSLRDGTNAITGVYEITADELRRLCDQLALEYPHRALTGGAVAGAMDDGAFRDRWVRMSRAVADWIRGKVPVLATGGVIG
jgi:hypothetical protein